MKFALLGEKLGHSYSKLIHERIYYYAGVDATYDLYELAKEEIPLALDKLKKGIYSGYNVTIPYKKEVMKYLDIIDSKALDIGSVNTISYVDGKLIGYNTDYYGFIDELKYYNINPLNKNCYILGTGGASLALNKALEDMGGNVTFVSRTKDNKDKTIDYNDLEKLTNIDILVNSTPIGMFPNVTNSPIRNDLKITTVVDIIFNPKITKLLSDYNSVYNGLMMLVSQALKADEIWLNKKLDIDLSKLLKEVEGIVYE